MPTTAIVPTTAPATIPPTGTDLEGGGEELGEGTLDF